MTQLEYAKKNISTDLIKKIAHLEGVDKRLITRMVRAGKVVILNNNKHKIKMPCAVGEGLRTKVNANIGTSPDEARIKYELQKLNTAVKFGSDTIMDLSVGGDLKKIRRQILKNSPLPVGTVPVYEIAVNAQKQKGDFLKFNADDVFSVLEKQAEEGVDFFTIHAGVTRKSLEELKKHKRLLNIVSRGGAILAAWMNRYKKENPFFEYFHRVLEIAYKYDIAISLGDGLRPGSILDSTDTAQLTELKTLGKLAQQAYKMNVGVIIEGPGHVPLNEIKKNIELEKKICHNAPFYVLGPLVTDVAAGYDHISAAIGGALAASYGADFLCYVTPAEHLRHPSIDDVKEGVIAAKIAAHAADIVKNAIIYTKWDRNISLARAKRDWNRQIALSICPEKARSYRKSSKPNLSDVCTMCGRYCSIKLTESYN